MNQWMAGKSPRRLVELKKKKRNHDLTVSNPGMLHRPYKFISSILAKNGDCDVWGLR